MQVDECSTELGLCTSDFVGIEAQSRSLRHYVAMKTHKVDGLVYFTKTLPNPWGMMLNLWRKPVPREAFSRIR